MVLATVVYLMVCSLAALAAPMLGSRRVPVAFWGIATIGLMAILVRSAKRKALSSGRRQSMGTVPVAVLFALVAACLAFVVMVNIWERLGIPH